MPRIAMLEGYRGPPSGGGRRRYNSSDRLGALGCAELEVAAEKLAVALGEAQRVGVDPSDVRYVAALAFSEKQNSFWNSEWVVFPEACRNLVAEATSLIGQLNMAIIAAGGSAIPASIGPGGPTPGIFESLGEIKWIAFGVLGIFALANIAPIVTGLTKRRGKR